MSFSVPLPARLWPRWRAGRARADAPRAGRFAALARPLSRAALLYFASFLWPSLAAAQISVEGRVGYQGTFHLGRPFPVEVEIVNRGRSSEGWAEVGYWKAGTAKGGAPYPVRSRREVFLSAAARKSVRFTVDPDFVSRPLIVSFTSAAGVVSREVDLRRHFSPTPVMLLAAQGNTVPRVALPPSLHQRIIAISLSDLPADPRAWLGVSHLILYEQPLRELSSPQLAALEAWLVAGGRLVVLGSLNYALYRDPVLSRFLPVRVTGARRMAWAPAFDGEARAAPLKDVWAQAATLSQGRVLVEAHGLPLVAEDARGKGRVVYCALDVGRPPLAGWDGLPALWSMLLAPSAHEDTAAPRTRWDEGVFSQLVVNPSFASAYVPTRSLFSVLALYLAGLGVFAWMWQRGRRLHRGLLPALFITYVLSSAAAGYAFFSRGGNIPDGVLLSATVLENSASGYAEAQTNLAVFSTQIRSYTLQLEPGWLDLAPVGSQPRDRSQALVVLQDGVSTRYRLPLREWDYRLFRLRSIARFDVRAHLEHRGDRLLVDVDNGSGKDLIGCWLLMPGQRHALGDIPNGARLNRIVPLGPARAEAAGGRPAALDFREVSFPDPLGETLFHNSFFSRHSDMARWDGSALFFGWVRNPDKSARIDDPRMRVHQYALFRATLPLVSPEDE